MFRMCLSRAARKVAAAANQALANTTTLGLSTAHSPEPHRPSIISLAAHEHSAAGEQQRLSSNLELQPPEGSDETMESSSPAEADDTSGGGGGGGATQEAQSGRSSRRVSPFQSAVAQSGRYAPGFHGAGSAASLAASQALAIAAARRGETGDSQTAEGEDFPHRQSADMSTDPFAAIGASSLRAPSLVAVKMLHAQHLQQQQLAAAAAAVAAAAAASGSGEGLATMEGRLSGAVSETAGVQGAASGLLTGTPGECERRLNVMNVIRHCVIVACVGSSAA